MKNIWIAFILFNLFLTINSFAYDSQEEFIESLNLTEIQKQKLQKLNDKTNKAYNAASTKIYYFKKNHPELSHEETNEYRDKLVNKIKKQYSDDLDLIFSPEQKKLYNEYQESK